MAKIEDKDHGYKALVNEVFKLENPVIRVGIFAAEGQEHYQKEVKLQAKESKLTQSGAEDKRFKTKTIKAKEETPVTVLDVATWQEFGTNKIPSRSFIRAWFDENKEEIRKKIKGLMIAVIKGKIKKDQALDQLGTWMVGSMQKRISQRIPPPLAESTIKAKGSDVPLIDTGVLRSSITYKVEDGR